MRGIVFAAMLLTALAPLRAQEVPPSPDGIWQLERIVLADGKEYRGLVQSRTEREIEFAEIIQRPGKPTFAIVRGIDPASVARVSRLPSQERSALLERFRQLRHRAVIEAGRMEEVQLATENRGGRRVFRYDGSWFTLISRADEESTRRCVVRIEQIFRAYRTLLPPRVKDPRPLEIELFASRDALRQELLAEEVSIDSPALYVPGPGRILAACELSEYSQRLAQVRHEAESLLKKYDQLEKSFSQKLSQLSGELRQAGFTREEISSELTLRKAAWNKERAETLERAERQMRRNEARFADVTGAMFRRLDHEALHAYLEHHVYPAAEHHVPQWLHEGLAQVFEHGQLEGDALRLDAPDPARLAALQSDLRSGDALPLAELLAVEGAAFTGRHEELRRRYYLYAWGIAHQLVFQDHLLAGPRFESYVAQEAKDLPPQERFELLVGQPLHRWQENWSEQMLELSPAAR